MITPIELQSRTFKTGIGYDKKEVEHFQNEILSEYEKIYHENIELRDKIAMINESLQHYKTIETTLQKALILAEKAAEETKKNAEHSARNIEKEAKNRAKEIVADAKNDLQQVYEQTTALVRNYDAIKSQFKQFLGTQLELLDTESFNINYKVMEAFRSENDIPENTSVEEKVAQTSEILDRIKVINDKIDNVDTIDECTDGEELVEDNVNELFHKEDTEEKDLNEIGNVAGDTVILEKIELDKEEEEPVKKVTTEKKVVPESDFKINVESFFAGIDD